MGEIIISVFIGGWMVFLGLYMNGALTKEEKGYRQSKSLEEGE